MAQNGASCPESKKATMSQADFHLRHLSVVTCNCSRAGGKRSGACHMGSIYLDFKLVLATSAIEISAVGHGEL